MINTRLAFSLIFLCIFTSLAQAAFVIDRVVAVVNQEVISWSELHRAMEIEANAAVKALPQEERNRIFRQNEAIFLDNLISFRLQIQEAFKNRLVVPAQEVAEAIDSIKMKYSMTDAEFQNSLRAEGYSFEEYRKRLSDQLLQSKIVNQQIRGKIVVTEADIDAFIKEDKDIADNSEAYRIRQIFFKKPKNAAEMAMVEEKAHAVYTQAQKGENFADLARRHTEDATRDSGGDLGFIKKGSMAKDFSAALTDLKLGDIGRPFWSDRGMHILRIEEITAPKAFSEIRADARAALQEKLFNERYRAWIRVLREKAFIDIRL